MKFKKQHSPPESAGHTTPDGEHATSAAPDVSTVLGKKGSTGFKGLVENKKSLGLALFASIGGFLYGYNQGVFGQVQVMANFHAKYAKTMDNDSTKGLLTSILELGAFFGSLCAGPLADMYSRKYSISAWCMLFMCGVAMQVGANHDIGCIYGMGVGALSMLVPMFNAELAPPNIRGSLVALQQLAITFGILVSYWIAYGTNNIGGITYDPVTKTGQKEAAWRVPLGLQLVPGMILCVGAIFLPFSPRWLMLKGREDECLVNLSHLRNLPVNDPEVQFEFKSLQAERLVEREAAKERYGVTDVNFRITCKEYKRLLATKPLLHRLLLGAGAQGLQQWTGINAIIYYAPTIGFGEGSQGLLATGIIGVVNFVMTVPAVLYVDDFGRKPLLMWGEANMAISHAVIAAIMAKYDGQFKTHRKAANGAIFMIYWYIANFAVTWGPLAWVVSAEVFPLDMRAKGMSISSGINWIMNFTVAMVTPVMFETIHYKTYIVFMCFCIVGFLYAAFILPELKGLSLEEIDEIFHDKSGQEDKERRERVARQVGLDKIAQEVEHKDDGTRYSSEKNGNVGHIEHV